MESRRIGPTLKKRGVKIGEYGYGNFRTLENDNGSPVTNLDSILRAGILYGRLSCFNYGTNARYQGGMPRMRGNATGIVLVISKVTKEA